jgi:hypothetical protein
MQTTAKLNPSAVVRLVENKTDRTGAKTAESLPAFNP